MSRHDFVCRRIQGPCALALVLLIAPLVGCHNRQIVNAAPPKPAPPPPKISEVDLRGFMPNEAGAVMILMYHRFEPNQPNTDMNRTPEQFREDLQALYKRGYRPVTVSELIENRMDVPIGKTPVALTFDDSYESQFKVKPGADGQPHIDPGCAVGILETFSKSHPDWKMKGTFFVLPQEGKSPVPFYQPEYVADKFAYLVKNGYEIGNHTTTHKAMNRLSPEKIQWEIGTAARYLAKTVPDAKVQVLALPYGTMPRKDSRKLLLDGVYQGTRYHYKAVLTAAWRPVLSPATKPSKRFTNGGKFAVFDPTHLERIKPDPRQAKLAGTFEYWLQYFDSNPRERYVSDGNVQVVAVPKEMKAALDESKLTAQGKIVQPYSLTASLGVAGPSSGGVAGHTLSVR